jgi:hypothetical protein
MPSRRAWAVVELATRRLRAVIDVSRAPHELRLAGERR